jgi:hypothetical protein
MRPKYTETRLKKSRLVFLHLCKIYTALVDIEYKVEALDLLRTLV